MTPHASLDAVRRARRIAAAAAALGVAAAGTAGRLGAQRTVVNSPRIPLTQRTTTSVTIGGAFSAVATPLTQSAQSGNLCSPGACYTGTVTARGNQAWRLQVRLAATPSDFTVRYIKTTTPPSAQAVNSGAATTLDATKWVTIATGGGATAGVAVTATYNADRVPGRNGRVPSAAELTTALAYQVVAGP